MGDDIELNIGINAKYLEDSINKVLERIEKSDGIKVGSPSKTLLKSPFAADAKEKTQVGKVHLDTLKKEKTEDPKLDIKNQFDALKKWSRVFKIDLFWRWIKGTWYSITKYMPMLGKFSEILTAALTLIFTALLLPFLPGILEALKWLLDKSVAFFNYMKGLEGLSPSAIAEKIVADINKLFTETDWGAYGKLIGKKINETVDFITDLLKKIKWDEFGKSVGEFINGILKEIDGKKIGETIATAINGGIKFLTEMFKGVKWDDFGENIGTAIGTFLKTVDWIGFGKLLWEGFIAAIGFLSGLAEGIDKATSPHAGWEDWVREHDPEGAKKLGLAGGGIVTSPTEALIGEAGPEAVIPLDQMKNMGGTSITVNGLVDEHKFRSIIREEIEKSNRRLFNARGAVSI